MIAKVHSTEASNAIEGIVTTSTRIKQLVEEKTTPKNKDLYYDALGQAQNGWHEGNEDVVPFIKYLLGTVLAAYKDFEDRFALVETKLPGAYGSAISSYRINISYTML